MSEELDHPTVNTEIDLESLLKIRRALRQSLVEQYHQSVESARIWEDIEGPTGANAVAFAAQAKGQRSALAKLDARITEAEGLLDQPVT